VCSVKLSPHLPYPDQAMAPFGRTPFAIVGPLFCLLLTHFLMVANALLAFSLFRSFELPPCNCRLIVSLSRILGSRIYVGLFVSLGFSYTDFVAPPPLLRPHFGLTLCLVPPCRPSFVACDFAPTAVLPPGLLPK